MDKIQSVSYSINLFLKWGTDSKAFGTLLTDSDSIRKTSLRVDSKSILNFTIESSLLSHVFTGSIQIAEGRNDSLYSAFIDSPISFGFLSCSALKDSSTSNKYKSILEYDSKNTFGEWIIITKKEVSNSDNPNISLLKLEFVSAEYINMISVLKSYSSFTKSSSTKSASEIIKQLFINSNIDESRIDLSSLNLNSNISFITTPNSNLLTSLNYIYRSIFNHSNDNYDYVRMIYDNINKKYKLWCFKDTLKKCYDNKKEDSLNNIRTHVITIDINADRQLVTSYNSVSSGTSGDLVSLLNRFGDKKYIDFDYVTNKFTTYERIDNSNNENVIPSPINDSSISKYNNLFSNKIPSKGFDFSSTATCSRDNLDYYDLFSDVIYKSQYINVNTEGHLGYIVGNTVSILFNNAEKTPYQFSSGVHIITGVKHTYSKFNDSGCLFTTLSVMTPWLIKDSKRKFNN